MATTTSKHSTGKASGAATRKIVTAPKKAAAKKATRKTAAAPKKAAAKKATAPKKAAAKKATRKWSAAVTEHSDALDLKQDVFKLRSAKAIAEALKKSATESDRKKGTPYQSAMSMLNFYINRAGKNLPAARLKILENAKVALRKAFGREEE